jgi:hypothetical protein
MKMLPQQLDLRITDADGTIFGLTYLDDGFAPTVPCLIPDCYRAASFMLYELRPHGFVQRACADHAPAAWYNVVRSAATDLRALVTID